MKSPAEKEVASKKTPERPSERTSKKAPPKDVSKEKPLSEKKEPKRKVIVFTKKRKI